MKSWTARIVSDAMHRLGSVVLNTIFKNTYIFD